jgi:SP family myo-inositol transporter-like MFS transporter 13
MEEEQVGRRFSYLLTFFASIGGFLFGYDTGVISGAKIFIEKEFDLENDVVMVELVVSGAIAGAVVGALS